MPRGLLSASRPRQSRRSASDGDGKLRAIAAQSCSAVRNAPVPAAVPHKREGCSGRRSSASPRFRPYAGRDHEARSEEHTSELQSLMRISYAVFCLKKNNKNIIHSNMKEECYNITKTQCTQQHHT